MLRCADKQVELSFAARSNLIRASVYVLSAEACVFKYSCACVCVMCAHPHGWTIWAREEVSAGQSWQATSMALCCGLGRSNAHPSSPCINTLTHTHGGVLSWPRQMAPLAHMPGKSMQIKGYTQQIWSSASTGWRSSSSPPASQPGDIWLDFVEWAQRWEE